VDTTTAFFSASSPLGPWASVLAALGSLAAGSHVALSALGVVLAELSWSSKELTGSDLNSSSALIGTFSPVGPWGVLAASCWVVAAWVQVALSLLEGEATLLGHLTTGSVLPATTTLKAAWSPVAPGNSWAAWLEVTLTLLLRADLVGL